MIFDSNDFQRKVKCAGIYTLSLGALLQTVDTLRARASSRESQKRHKPPVERERERDKLSEPPLLLYASNARGLAHLSLVGGLRDFFVNYAEDGAHAEALFFFFFGEQYNSSSSSLSRRVSCARR